MVIVTKQNRNLNEIELLNRNIQVLASLPEIQTVCNEDYVLIFEGYENVKDFVGYMETLAHFSKAKVYYVYSNHFDTALQLKNSLNCVEINQDSIIDNSLIEYVIYNDNISKMNISKGDEHIFIENLINTDNSEFILSNIRGIKLLAISYTEQQKEIKRLIERLQIKDVEVQNSEENAQKAREEYEEIIEGYEFLEKNFRTMRDAYKRCVYSEENFDVLSLANYDNPPQIIYIKEYEEMIHLNSFLDVLQQTIKRNMGKSCKVIQLVGRGYRNKALTKPPEWYVCNTTFNVKDVYTHELILKGGNYTELIDKLLINEMGLNYLIIVDSLGLDKNIIQGKYYRFNICRNERNIETYQLDRESTIVNNSKAKDVLSYNSMDYNTYKSMDLKTKYMLLANQRAINEIILTLKASARAI